MLVSGRVHVETNVFVFEVLFQWISHFHLMSPANFDAQFRWKISLAKISWKFLPMQISPVMLGNRCERAAHLSSKLGI